MSESEHIILTDVCKEYRARKGAVQALQSVSLESRKNEFIVIKGPSGSGKSTLLLMLGAMLKPSGGSVVINGTNIYSLNIRDRAAFRADNIGFVFQMFHLISYLNVLENVLLAAWKNGSPGESESKAQSLLEKLGLENRVDHTPGELSAGERQRVGIARAMMNNPTLILADEPTGNLDQENAKEVITHLKDFRDSGGTVMMVTHGDVCDDIADRTLFLKDGLLIEDQLARSKVNG
jgi:ABC-type lipoprotein export system ATPase subunit